MKPNFVLPHGLELGDFVLLSDPGPARGLGRLVELVDHHGEPAVRVELPGQDLTLRITADAAGTLRPAMAGSEAEAILATLEPGSNAPDDRPADARYITSIKTLSRGAWSDVGRRLGALYASPWKPTFGELKMLDMYEIVLVPMIAHATGQDVAALKRSLRTRQPVFSGPLPRPSAEPGPAEPSSPAIEGFESLYSFEVTGELWLGERLDWHGEPDNGLARVSIQPGTWYAYRTAAHEDEDEDGNEDPVVELFLIHESRLGERAEAMETEHWRRAADILRTVGSGAVNLIDGSALTDEQTMDRVRYLGGTATYGGRALCVATDGWSGPLPVFVTPREGLPTILKIPLTDET